MILEYHAVGVPRRAQRPAGEGGIVPAGEAVDADALPPSSAAAAPPPSQAAPPLAALGVLRDGVFTRLDELSDRLAEGRPLPPRRELAVALGAGVAMTFLSGAVAQRFGAGAGLVGAVATLVGGLALDVALKRAMMRDGV